MTYPAIEFVHEVAGAGDFECLKTWHDGLAVMHEIECSLVQLGKLDEEDCIEAELLFEMGGEA